MSRGKNPFSGARGTNGHGPETAFSGGWQFRTLVDAYQPREPTRYLVDGVIPEGTLGILFGPPGGMKTMVCNDSSLGAVVRMGTVRKRPFLAAGKSEHWLRPINHGSQPAIWLRVSFQRGRGAYYLARRGG